jgi:hypothetical protein
MEYATCYCCYITIYKEFDPYCSIYPYIYYCEKCLDYVDLHSLRNKNNLNKEIRIKTSGRYNYIEFLHSIHNRFMTALERSNRSLLY